jgi:hypothetical protein
MKSKDSKSKKVRESEDSKIINKRGYYFHSDDNFIEDWDWEKQKSLASKSISKRSNKFEV